MSDVRLIHGEAVRSMIRLRQEGVRVDAVVTDPPYHLTTLSRGGSPRVPGTGPFGRHTVGQRGFMGKTWDGGDVAMRPRTWRAAYCLLPEGGRLLAFGGARTAHRITCAIEDAGFVIEDVVMWLYGSRLPEAPEQVEARIRAHRGGPEGWRVGPEHRRGADTKRTRLRRWGVCPERRQIARLGDLRRGAAQFYSGRA